MTSGVISAAIFGCAGLTLSKAEKSFFAETRPLGFILFARNIDTPDQVRRLVDDLRTSVERPDAPVLIDQEGGRVQRLRAPHWREAPPARPFGDLYEQAPDRALHAIQLNHRLIAQELTDLGIDVDCVPCLDVPVEGAHDVIGNRAFSTNPETVIACGKAAAEGLLAGGVLPIAKHIPGHGRATADSHFDLPRVDTPRTELDESDFIPFQALSDIRLGMTAHIVFDAIDSDRPVTQSPAGIDFIRQDLGFDGLLMTDDLSMKALGGTFSDRARLSLQAGCDLVLHCNGDPTEMASVVEGLSPLSEEGHRRWRHAAAQRSTPAPLDVEATLAELNALLG